MIKRKIHIFLTIGAFSSVILVGNVVAFFTETEQRTNAFTVGKVTIDINEDFEQNQIVYPEETVEKNPSVENIGKNTAYVFLEVDVPKAKVTLLNDSGQFLYPQYDADGKMIENYSTTSKSLQEIFSITSSAKENETLKTVVYGDSSANIFSYHSTWSQLENKTIRSGKDYNTYVFYYSTPLKSGNSTETLFDKIKLKKFIDSEFSDNEESSVTEVSVRAYAIQADNLENMTNTDTSQAVFYEELYDIIKNRL